MIFDKFCLKSKVAIVTGCSTGLGQGMILGLAEAGADIVGVGYMKALETKQKVEALGRKFLGITANLMTTDPIPQIIDQAVNTFGKIDILMLSFQGGIQAPSYTASKSGVMGITRALANEWAKYNININAIAPGYMATNNTDPLRADEQRYAEILCRIPARRWGTPEDLQGIAVCLASDASNYINGFTIAVDGGWLAR